jgi:hypothetical protein
VTQLTYGTAEYYAEAFADFLADVDATDPATTDNLIKGFYLAIDGWFEHHDAQARAYAELRKRVRQTLTV